ncbi:MAG: M20/M25/M40 family metallo-hydrolase, partial [Deltaproteobacteria bacterium]
IEAGDGVALLFLPDRGLRTLAEQIHARFDRCGGFMVHDSLEEASDAYEAAAEAASGARAADARPGPGYTIDHGASVRAVLPALDRARIRDTIRELSAMPNRYYRSSSGAAASIWLRDRWRSFTNRADVTVELFETGYPQKSVILTIPGRARASEVVVIGGHLDSISLGGATGNAPGADDDASGIATLTEVARVLLASDYRPARTIQFIAYAAEEVGLRGSLQIANDYRRRHIDVVGALQLDMTNYRGSDKDIWLMKDFTSAAQNGFLGRLIDTYVGATWGYDACGYACSDHAAWHRTGVPASLPFEARMREANRAIHTRQDTLETSGPDAAHAVAFARLAAAYAIELGKGELAGPAPDPAPARRFEEVGAGSAGHPGAALSVALLILGLWVARRAIARTG